MLYQRLEAKASPAWSLSSTSERMLRPWLGAEPLTHRCTMEPMSQYCQLGMWTRSIRGNPPLAPEVAATSSA